MLHIEKLSVGDNVKRTDTGEILTIAWIGDLGNYLGFTDKDGYFELSTSILENYYEQ